LFCIIVLASFINYLMPVRCPINDYCDYLIVLPAALQVGSQLQAWPLSSRRQDITQFLMKFVAQLTYLIGDITALAFTCGFKDVVSSADLKQ
jgi:hypothetical protein